MERPNPIPPAGVAGHPHTRTLLACATLCLMLCAPAAAQGPAVPSSVDPAAGTGPAGLSRTFTAVFTDSAGYADITAFNLAFGGTSNVNACYLTYYPALNALMLWNDAGTAAATGYPGTPGTLSNSQCSVSLAETALTGNLTALTFTVPVTFTMGFAGVPPLDIYALAVNSANQYSAWLDLGTCQVTAPTVPSPSLVSPPSGSSGPAALAQSFTVAFTDAAGYADVSSFNLVFGGTTNVGTCYLTAYPGINLLVLWNDAGTASTSGHPGSAGTLSNSQCSVDLANTHASGAGYVLSFTVPVTFTPAFSGTRQIWSLGVNAANQYSAWAQLGNWTVTTLLAVPSLVSPPSGSSGPAGAAQAFTVAFTDAAGWADVSAFNVVFGGTSNVGACYLTAYPGINLLVLWNDAGTAYTSGYPGSAGVLSNSQCSVDLSTTHVTGDRITLTFTVSVTFTSAFAGTREIYALGVNSANQYSPWVDLGSWTVMPVYSIGGQVTSSGVGLSGVTMTLSGSSSGSATTDANGNYSFTGLAAGGSYTVSASKAGYTLSGLQTFGNLSVNQAANFTATLQPDFTVICTMTTPSSGQVPTSTSTQYAIYTVTVRPNAAFANTSVLVTLTAPLGSYVGSASGYANPPDYAPVSLTIAVQPHSTPATYQMTLTAISQDPNHSLSKTYYPLMVIGSSPVSVVVTPSSPPTLGPGATQQFNAQVAGTANSSVAWSLSPQTGAIDNTGLYTAPNTIQVRTSVSVTATSQAFPGSSGSSTVTLQPTGGSGPPDFTFDQPTAFTVEAGFQSSFRLKIAPQGGFNSPVTWTVTLPPSLQALQGVSAIWAANSQPGLSAIQATATVALPASVAPGQYTVAVAASGAGVSHSVNVTMSVAVPFRAQSETNVGPISFLEYDINNSLSSYPFLNALSACAGLNMRPCYQQIMAIYRNQQISGVRFMFDLADAFTYTYIPPIGGYLQPPAVSLNQTWIANVEHFFEDLYANGIYKITPTIREWTSAPWSLYQGVVASTDNPVFTTMARCGPSMYTSANIQTLRFAPTAPYGEVCRDHQPTGPSDHFVPCDTSLTDLTKGDWDIDGRSGGAYDGYFCSVANPVFVGWSNIYDVIDALLQAARDNALTVEEFDAQNEIQLSVYPVRGRIIVDNQHSIEDVLGNLQPGVRSLRQSMQSHGFDPGRVTYSVTDANPMVPNGECPASNPTYFGDSARLTELSMLTATIAAGGPFGSLSWNYDLPAPDDLQGPSNYPWTGFACGADATGAGHIYITHSLPTIIDVHSGPCVLIPRFTAANLPTDNGWGQCNFNAQPLLGVPTWANVQGEATAMGNALSSFQSSFSLTGWRGYVPNMANALIALGETHGRLKSGCLMFPGATGPPLQGQSWDPSTGQNTFAGFTSSGILNNTLANGLPASLVFRPWEYLQQGDAAQANACNTIYTNPPYTPVR